MSLKIELLSLLSNDLLMIIRETENKKICQKWPWSLKKFERWSLTRELLKQYLTEKQNGCLQSGHL